MQNHTKVYLLAVYETLQPDEVKCEVCLRYFTELLDVHHINARGSGGSKFKIFDVVENLMGACRQCHTACENGTYTKESQIASHKLFLDTRNIAYTEAKLYWNRHRYTENFLKNGK